ncbi:MAG: hypothetical protein Q7K98_03720 [Candidatus Omnitrophota bacterium]|nr:hypothetical protein [Candidatus Omnitrophota bacterium]
MIEINLLPEELRNKVVKLKKPEATITAAGLEPKHFILLIPLAFGILIGLQLIIGLLGLTKSVQARMLDGKWSSLEPERKALKEFNDKYNLVSEDTQIIQQLMRTRVNWSEKLNSLSLNLPAGVWFEEILVNSKELALQGAVVSLNKEELSLIKQLIDNLKNDPAFFRDFNYLEMGSAKKKAFGSYDITEFTLNASLKAK